MYKSAFGSEQIEQLSPFPSYVISLFLQIPKSLNKPDGYDHREALFGIPPYGGSIQAQVFYADSELCGPTVNTSMGYPTRDVNPKTGLQKPWTPPFILMVDRGACTFVQKVRNAQRAGAAGVLIADNTCLCSFPQCSPDNADEPCEVQGTCRSFIEAKRRLVSCFD